MDKLSGIIIYNKIDAEKNKWFIEHFISVAKDNNTSLSFVLAEDIMSFILKSGNLCQEDKYASTDFVINRSRNRIISKYFENRNIRVFNSSFVTKIANDKALTYNYLKNNNIDHLPYISIPKEFIIGGNDSEIIISAKSLCYPLVLKPAEGHGGAHIFLVNSDEELLSVISNIKDEYNSGTINYSKFLLQKKASTEGKDLRVYVLNNKIIKGVMRTSDSDFRSNFSLGGNANLYELTTSEEVIINSIISIFPSDFIGIDLIYNNEMPILNEIEDAVGCRMLYSKTDIDIIELYLEHIKNYFTK